MRPSFVGMALDPRRLRPTAATFYENRLYLPAHLGVYLRDVLKLSAAATDLEQSLQAAVDWLAYAQDVGGGGVAAYYSFRNGWSAPYPETTGYIIPTVFDYYHFTGQREYRDRALRMSNWELQIQLPEGAFPGGHTGAPAPPVVFNTGQVLQGLVRAYSETGDERYRRAAARAGDWLVGIQEADGSWLRHTYRNTVHTYHTRVAWPLCDLYLITNEGRYAVAAERNLQWAMRSRLSNGWFRHNTLYLHSANALTHSIAYAIQGFLEAGVLFSQPKYIEAAKQASDVLLDRFRATGDLQASFDSDWMSSDAYSCLTGNAQMAVVWFRLFAITRDERYARAASDMTARIRGLQNTSSSNRGIRGGIAGSDPISGGYMPMCYPNWAAKFFVDALLLEEKTAARGVPSEPPAASHSGDQRSRQGT